MDARTDMLAQAALSPPAISAFGQQPAESGLPPNGMGRAFLALPFDAIRFQYAGAVMAGLVPRSILASAKFERALDALERLTLGALARQR